MDDQKMNGGEGSVGPVIATIIILAVIVLGGLYFWNQKKSETAQRADASAYTPLSADALQAIQSQSSSDATASIEADLKATNTSNVDSSLTQ